MLSAMVSTSSYREGAVGILHSATRVRIWEDYPRIMAGAYLKAPCPKRASTGPYSGSLWRHTDQCMDLGSFHEGRGAGKSTTPGVEKSMLFLGGRRKSLVYSILLGLFSYLFSDDVGSFFPSL